MKIAIFSVEVEVEISLQVVGGRPMTQLVKWLTRVVPVYLPVPVPGPGPVYNLPTQLNAPRIGTRLGNSSFANNSFRWRSRSTPTPRIKCQYGASTCTVPSRGL